MFSRVSRFAPGLLLLVAMGVVARLVSTYVPFVNDLILVILLGILIGNLYGRPEWAEAGAGKHKLLLETGIVIMGVRVVLDQIVQAGLKILVVVVAMVIFSVLLVELLANLVFDLKNQTGSLLAAGLSICGVSAIVAVAGSIKADEDNIAYAVATILLFDAVTIFLYPLVGRLLHLPDRLFGIWAGISMFSTGPVVAAGFAYSQTAGQWATLTKLTRNVFIGVAAVAYAIYYARKGFDADRFSSRTRYVWSKFPKFVVGFCLVIVVASLGLITKPETAALKEAYSWLFVFAFAGLGLNINVRDMRDAGIKPILIALINLLTISALSLAILSAIFM